MSPDDFDRAATISLERRRRRIAGQSTTLPTDRESIAAFLRAEAERFDREAAKLFGIGNAEGGARCSVRAALCRTLSAQVQRGEDRPVTGGAP